MLPYDGTPIKDELERNGRLKGDVCHPDYDFLDENVTTFYNSLSEVVDVLALRAPKPCQRPHRERTKAYKIYGSSRKRRSIQRPWRRNWSAWSI
jgi:hypothetical protein